MKLLIIGYFLSVVLTSGVRAKGPIVEVASASEQLDLNTRELDTSFFLPRNKTIPYHYFIHLKSHVQNNDPVFEGTVDIYFEVVEPTKDIVMHLQELDIVSTELSRIPNGLGVPVKIDNPQYSIDTKTELVTFTSQADLPLGKYILNVAYTGTMRRYQSGFFISSYRDESNKVHYVGSSHFQATLARRVFPCFDEPDLKATFKLWITHHGTYNAVANTYVDTIYADSEDPEYRVTQFRTTPRMSTYLLAFAVTDFVAKTDNRQQVLVRPEAFGQVDVTLTAGSKIIAAMDAHTGVAYHDYMDKLSHIAVPDRGTGAMENWGLVTYGEPSMLFDPAVNSYRTYKRVITVVAHELAHQWFGNLVSPRWWEYIWLNEGFATLYEYYATTLAYPELDYWELFNVEVIQRALSQDARESTRAMNTPAASQDEVHALFDIIAYQKSGSVLNMFRTVLGDENWMEALNIYIEDRKLDSATPEDLYDALQKAIAGKRVIPASTTVKQLMESWTDAAGYPVLNIRRNYKSGQILMSQEQFLADKWLPNNHVWNIPYNYIDRNIRETADGSDYQWLTTKTAVLETETPNDQWIIFNREQFGYYRVNYDQRNWELIIDALLTNPLAIHRANRAQLIDDAFNLARSERLDMVLALKLLTYLRLETEYAPWAAANNALNYLYSKLQGTVHYPGFVNFVSEIVSDVYKTLEVDKVSTDEPTLHKYLKQTITGWACRVGNQDCLDKTYDALKREFNEAVAVHPDVASVVYCHGLREGTYRELSYLVPKMIESINQAQRTEIITALGCTKDTQSITSLLAIINLPTVNYLSTEKSQIVDAIVAGTSSEGLAVLVQYLMTVNNARALISAIGEGSFRNVLLNIASRSNNASEQQRLQQVLTVLSDLIPKETVDDALGRIKANVDWFTSLEGLVTIEFFDKYYSNAVPVGRA
ncbi:aminopeptidase N isoform X1 [Aedes aegypti]|uniref:Aminopeptidase n=1 Tax=Aedes aegypti TaxID=7159 RepID=A0A1S4FIN5_AEDAE|nr:aminopeptidase N isoform X1 [Aedes aegypti]